MKVMPLGTNRGGRAHKEDHGAAFPWTGLPKASASGLGFLIKGAGCPGFGWNPCRDWLCQRSPRIEDCGWRKRKNDYLKKGAVSGAQASPSAQMHKAN
jgi:hypothetical protein